jgi:hypothetical protein
MYADHDQARAQFGYTPTFIPRSNVQGDYGDNQQDFWLSATQRDWSLGEQQRFFRQADEASRRRFWRATNVRVAKQGEVRLNPALSTVAFGSSVIGATSLSSLAYTVSSTNLFSVDLTGVKTDHGAHGASAPGIHGVAADTSFIYIGGDTGNLRRWNGATFSTFSADSAAVLEYNNNTLFGYRPTSGDLVRWSTAGVRSSLFTWRAAEGTSVAHVGAVLRAFGGKLAILFPGEKPAPTLWIYDGAGVSKIDQYPSSFEAWDMAVAGGSIFVSGLEWVGGSYLPTIRYWANGSSGVLWRADSQGTYAPALAAFDEGLIFTDSSRGTLMVYNLAFGGVSALASFGVVGEPLLAANSEVALLTQNHATGHVIYATSAVPSSGTITSSLFDFDSSLNKIFRGLRVEFDAGSDGNGGSVDIAYRVNDVDSTYTTLQTGAVSGTEYALSGISGRSISVKITLNKGTSTSGPVLKRLSVRAVPVQLSFQRKRYALYLGGRDGKGHNRLRDGTGHPKDGLEQAILLRTAATASAPFAVTDEFGTVSNCIIETDGFDLRRVGPQEYLATVTVREV